MDPQPEPLAVPVFVDDSGRRRRLLRIVGWLTGALAFGFLVLIGISLMASPGLLPLSLPGVGSLLPNASAPKIVTKTDPAHKKVPAATLLPTPSARPTGGGSTPAPAATAASRPTPTPTASRTRGNSHATPSATPSPSATPAVTSRGNPSPHGSPRPTHTSHGNG